MVGFLRILSDDNYRGHHGCPCESGKMLRHCHGRQLLYVSNYQTPADFLKDYLQIINYIFKNKENNIQNRILKKHLVKPFKKQLVVRKTNQRTVKEGEGE